MKRFFLVTAFASVFAVLISQIFNNIIPYAIVASIIVLVIGVLLYSKFKAPYAVLSITFTASLIIMMVFSNYYCNYLYSNAIKYNDKEITVKAIVNEEPTVYEEYSSVTIKTVNNKKIEDNINILIYYDNSYKLKYNDIIKFKTKLSVCENKSYYSDKVFLKGYANELKQLKTNRINIYSKAIALRKHISNIFINKINDSVVGIPIGMLTGNRSYISNDFNNNVKSVGMTHVMAVSGLHISIICMSVVLFLRKKLKLGNWIPAVIGIVIVVIMAAIAGFSGSILRAGIMYFVVFLGNIISRRSDSLNSLGFAVTALLIYNPFNVFSVSLALSALGTYGILVFANGLNEMFCELYPFKKFLRKPFEYLSNSLSVTLTASLFIIPVSLFTFGYISSISPIVNIILSPIVYLCLMFSLLAIIFSYVPIISTILLYIVELLSTVFKYVVDYFAEFKFICFYNDDILLYIFLSIILLVLVLVFAFGRIKTITVILSLTLAIILPVLSIAQGYINSSKYQYYFVGSEKGAIMLIESSEHFVLVCNSTDRKAYKQIKSIINKRLSPQIDLLIVPTPNDKAVLSSLDYFKDINIKDFLLCSNNAININNTFEDNPKIKIWNKIILKSSKSFNGYNLYFNTGTTRIVFDTYSAKANKGDYILTTTPVVSYKINRNSTNYIITGTDRNSSVSNAINHLNGKALSLNDNEIIFATQNGNKVLKFHK